MRRLLVVGMLWIGCTCPIAAAGERDAPRPGDAPPPETLTFDALQVRTEELPPGVEVVEGLPCVSRQPRAYFENPSPWDLAPPQARERAGDLLRSIPVPRRKASQSFRAQGGRAGSVMWFEFADGGAKKAEPWFCGYLWGPRAKGPSAEHPETILVVGDVLVLTSFVQGDPAHEWYKARLRKKFGAHAPRWSAATPGLVQKALAAYDSGAFAETLEAFAARAEVVSEEAFLSFLRGELAMGAKDFAEAERGYRRALELHESREDSLEPDLVFATLDGLGAALVVQKKAAEGVRHLERAAAIGRARLEPKQRSGCLYNLACGYSLLRRWKQAHDALEEALAADPARSEQAKSDEDLREALKRPEFRKLLGN